MKKNIIEIKLNFTYKKKRWKKWNTLTYTKEKKKHKIKKRKKIYYKLHVTLMDIHGLINDKFFRLNS